MPYDHAIAERLRDAMMKAAPAGIIEERKMFGGLTLMLDGSMVCGVLGSELVVRTGAAGMADALRLAHVRPMDFTGRPLKGFVFVAGPGFADAAALDAWVARGLAGAREASAKKKPRPSTPRPASVQPARRPRITAG